MKQEIKLCDRNIDYTVRTSQRAKRQGLGHYWGYFFITNNCSPLFTYVNNGLQFLCTELGPVQYFLKMSLFYLYFYNQSKGAVC